MIVLLELSLTVPITNSLAFLFTVLGEWYVEKKVISRGIFSVEKLEIGWKCSLLICGRYLDWDDIIIMWDCALCAK